MGKETPPPSYEEVEQWLNYQHTNNVAILPIVDPSIDEIQESISYRNEIHQSKASNFTLLFITCTSIVLVLMLYILWLQQH
ncbi:hypothetical protein HCN44_000075 [Aphidius gifuensis]|uniref:Uncharacterized protein n=1 Tax=Aphidius gifuensis TaxID=684658 RepID=A0A834XNC3_APHGI|nr:hypothetical protein HCN44_000075 [Aphidius gifuensis]